MILISFIKHGFHGVGCSAERIADAIIELLKKHPKIEINKK